MPSFHHTSRIDTPAEDVFAWHARSGALERLLPPWEAIRVVERTGGIRNGDRVVLELRLGPIPTRWVVVHRDFEDGRQFADEQETGLFRRWRHVHRFRTAPEGGCFMEDDVDYELPFDFFGEWVAGAHVRHRLERSFAWRHRRTGSDLARHKTFAGSRPLRVAITGASGLVGSNLSAFLSSGGHRVDPVVRRPPRSGSHEVHWDPAAGSIDAEGLENADAVVHLAGENLFGFGWTEAKKREIRESRVAGTRLLATALAGLQPPPKVLISASAVGYYGDCGEEGVDEQSGPGQGFLAGVCQEWEAATAPAEAAGVRVVRLRIGIVLSARGGALRKMLPSFRLGLGAVFGSGRQFMSWIGIDDLVGIIHQALFDERFKGPVNAVAPHPVTNRELTTTLARVLHRPVVLRAPEVVLRMLGGEMAGETLLAGVRARSARLQEFGFPFLTPSLEEALRWELGI